MKTLQSHVCGQWHEPTGDLKTIHKPCTEEPIASVSSAGIDFREALGFARDKGGVSLRRMTFAERGQVLESMWDDTLARLATAVEDSEDT